MRVEKDVLLHQLDKERSRYGRRYLLSSSLAEGNSSETVADPLPLSAGAGEGSSRLRESLDSLCPQSFSSSVDISAAAGEITSG